MDGPGTLFGRPVVYDSPTTIHTPVGSFEEIISPRALDDLLRTGPDTTLVRDHDPGRLLGRTTAGTLSLANRPAGLDVRASLPPTALGEETAVLVDRRDLNGMSFAFNVASEEWRHPRRAGGDPVRVVTRISRLFDVSVVTWPAYRSTTVSVHRSDDAARRHELGRQHMAAAMAMVEGGPATMRQATLADQHARMVARSTLGPIYRTLPAVATWCREHRRVVRRCSCTVCGR